MDLKEEKLEDLKKKKEKLLKKQAKKEEEEKKDKLIKQLGDNVNELQTKLIERQAEFQNYKRRTEEERIAMLKYCNQDLGKELLVIVDSLERSLVVNENADESVKKYVSGISLTYNNLIQVLNKFEIKEIDCLNKEFDHNTCQALMTEKKEGVEEGIVIEVLQKGYMIKDKLLRPALVKVSE